MEYRMCNKCGKSLELNDTNYRKYKNINAKIYFRRECRECGRKYHKEWLIKTNWKDTPINKRNSRLKTKYGITQQDYENMYEKQQGCCYICGDKRDKLVIDHNHETGKVRKLLCSSCNNVVGLCKEDISILLKTIEYLGGYNG